MWDLGALGGFGGAGKVWGDVAGEFKRDIWKGLKGCRGENDVGMLRRNLGISVGGFREMLGRE